MGKLLEKAKSKKPRAIKRKKPATNEEIKLCLAWLNNEITTGQFNHAMDNHSYSNGYLQIGLILRDAVMNKKIKIKLNNNYEKTKQ